MFKIVKRNNHNTHAEIHTLYEKPYLSKRHLVFGQLNGERMINLVMLNFLVEKRKVASARKNYMMSDHPEWTTEVQGLNCATSCCLQTIQKN